MMEVKAGVWKKFGRNRLAFTGMCWIILTLLCAVFAVPLSPDPSVNANSIHLPLAAQKPGFTVDLICLSKPERVPINWFDYLSGFPQNEEEIPILSWELRQDTLFYTGYYEDEQLAVKESRVLTNEMLKTFRVESKTFLLGTDRFGRDMLSRMLLGARISLSVGLIAVLISMLVGVFFGATAAYYGGRVDKLIQWLMNVMWSLPTLLLVIAFSLALGKGLWQIFIAIGLSMWVDVARMVRGQVLSLKEKEFVEASKVLGLSDGRILFRHILPNITGPLTVVAAANFASAILLEAGLSFLGLGVQAPTPSWGQMIKDHYGYIVLDSAYLALVPGLAIMLLVMSFNFVGNGLRDALDVRLR